MTSTRPTTRRPCPPKPVPLALALLAALGLLGQTVQAAPPTVPAPSDRPMIRPQATALDASVRQRRITLEIEPIGAVIDERMTRFRGDVSLEFVVTRPTRTIELHAQGLDVRESSLDEDIAVAAPTATGDGQRLRWTLPSELPVGDHRLNVRYEGTIQTSAEGLYRIDSPAPGGGGKLHALATQMEPTGARKLLPLWDEPGYRVPVELALVLPKDVPAISNTPVVARDLLDPDAPGGPERIRHIFAGTPPMPSYLLAFFAGPFEQLKHPRTSPRIAAWTMPGKSASAQLALEVTDRVLDAYRDYFAQPYTLDKLDSIALPGGFGGAMENWGAIAYNEATLLYDPSSSPASRRMDVFGIVAHEVAHQWFGNLVTMGWWDDLWLNEGFATWMAARTTQQLNPDEPVWADEALGIDRAMQQDALAGAGAIRRPVKDDREAFASFDEITYQKGMAFIRMLEQWLGPEVFRDGLRRYMADHALGNATTDDLWRDRKSVV
jgi:aminopeptidase N